ncbi:MAG TPA: PaaX family transcriptional regulator C-terminal domain-containing protein [Acidimicrobiia bacterium]|nr:PaaX family transcriptional regulator C-terminal domain-containing protein [Acidimicrobiia bacterium]
MASARRRGGRDAAPAPARPTGTRASLGRPRTGESARSLLNTVLGEFVYPVGGAAWTHSFIEALGRLDVDEKATRQALARTAADGWLERERHGRRIRWRLSPQGLQRCIDGTVRIESFGGVRTDWDGRWLLLFVSVPEAQRALGHRLRRRLTWAGFGPLGQGAWITPHVDLEPEASRIISELPASLHAVSFVAHFKPVRPRDDGAAFVAQTRLVHEWRRFAFGDPVLPAELLPSPWVGAEAKRLVDERTASWLPRALAWFRALDAADGAADDG